MIVITTIIQIKIQQTNFNNILYEKDNIINKKKISKSSSCSSSNSYDNPTKENNIINSNYNPSLINESFRLLIIGHKNIAIDNLV